MLDRLKKRLMARGDSEHEQAALRIIIVGLVLGYMACFHGSPRNWSSVEWTIILGLSGFFTVALAIFAAICIRPDKNVPRRLIGMLADNGGATWYMCLAGEYGFSMIGVFLFVTFGNGFRYGRRYLFGSQLLSLLGYSAVQLFVPYWQAHRSAGVGLLIALIVLPLYISTLLERIQEARAKAEEANLAKTSFLANMSHEMRTPLNGIVGVVDLLRTTALSAQQVELVALLRHSIAVLRSLVDDVLDITKIEAGRLTIEVAPFDLHACVNGLIQLLRPHAEAKGLTLNAYVDPALEYRVRGDSHHLRQILLNLLGNAIKFTEKGSVTLSVGLQRESTDGVNARFEVKDTGIGIAADALPKIFERFVQADQSTTRKYGGTGLGTTIAKQLVEIMGGTIGVESKAGEGSLFWIEVPLLRDIADALQSTASSHEELADDRAITLVISAPGYADATAALRSLGERYEVVPAATVGSRLEAFQSSGATIRAIVASCAVEQACAIFNSAVQRLASSHVALIYIANGEVSVVDRARVNSINGAFALAYPTAKLIANAIHVVNAGVEGAGSTGADLQAVLGRQRQALKILVAEDNTTNQKIIKQLLQSAGYEVILASDGEMALDLYERECPDIGIFDFNMPLRTGVEVIQAIRTMEPPGERMPSIILSASVTIEARQRAANAGADQFLGKPFDAAALIQHIDRFGNGLVSKKPKVRLDERRTDTPSTLTVANGRAAMNASAVPDLGQPKEREDLVDSDRLAQLEDIARDRSFLGELINGFITDVEVILLNTERAIAAGAVMALPDLMHSLKGAAVSVGAIQLANLATKLDQAVTVATPSEELVRLTRKVRKCFEATSAHLARFLQGRLESSNPPHSMH